MRSYDEYQKNENFLINNSGCFQGFRDLWCNKRILNMIEQLIGPDIAGHPVWNMRTKTPNSKALDVPWHQGMYTEHFPVHILLVSFSSAKVSMIQFKIISDKLSAIRPRAIKFLSFYSPFN